MFLSIASFYIDFLQAEHLHGRQKIWQPINAKTRVRRRGLFRFD